jgi:hypothetical protein
LILSDILIICRANMDSDVGFQAALEEARKGFDEGGVPIGAALVSANGTLLGRGHNMRMQKGSATLHVSRPHRRVRVSGVGWACRKILD